MSFGLSASEYGSQAGRANGNGRRGLLRLVGVGCVCLFMFVGTQESRARIVEITELVRDAQNVTWANLDGIPVTLGERGAAVDFVRSATKASDGGNGFISDLFPERVIEVEAAPTLGRKDTGVRGAYTVTLPDIKLIQLEVAYDLIAEGPETRGQMDFYIEMQQRNKLDPNQWITVATFDRDIDRSKIETARIITYKETRYTPHCFVEKISEWRGQEVRLVLAAEAPKSAVSPQRGRWVEVRLVAASYDYIFDIAPPYGQVNAKSPRMKAGPLVYDESMTTGIQSIYFPQADPNDDLYGYPDTGLSAVWKDNTHCLAYFAASLAVNHASKGTFALKFDENDSLFKNTGVIRDSLLRDGSDDPIRVLYYMAHPHEDLDNKYLGVTGAMAGNVKGTTTIHVFMKAEDHYDNHSDPGNPELYATKYPNPPKGRCYGRICQATSTDGENFTRTGPGGSYDPDDFIDGLAPVITHWQSEAVAYGEIIPPTYTVYPGGVQGVGSAHVIEASDGYYYMFYTRFIDSRLQSRGSLPAASTTITMATDLADNHDLFVASMCVARAAKSDINGDFRHGYNPWNKYYDGHWDENGIGGYDTAVLLSVPSTSGKVSWNTYLNTFIMVTMTRHNEDHWTFYIHESTDLINWVGHVLDGIYLEDWGTAYPSLVGGIGTFPHLNSNDAVTSKFNYLYYARDDDGDGGLTTGDQWLVRRYLEFIQ